MQFTALSTFTVLFFLTLNLFRTGGYVVNGTFTPQILEMMLVSAVPLVAALWVANHLHFRVNERLFRRVVAWVILLGGVSLLFR